MVQPSRLLTSRGKPSLTIDIPPNHDAKAHPNFLCYSESQQLRILGDTKQGSSFMVHNSLNFSRPSSLDSTNAPQNVLTVDEASSSVLLTPPEYYLPIPPTPSTPALEKLQRRTNALPFSKAHMARSSQSGLDSSNSGAATPSPSEERFDALGSPLLPVPQRPQRSRESSPKPRYGKKHVERRGRALTRQKTADDLAKTEERYNNLLPHSYSIIGRQIYLSRINGTLVPELPQNLRLGIYEREGNGQENWAEYLGTLTVRDLPQLPQCLQIDMYERGRNEQENWAEYWGRPSVHAWIRGVGRGVERDFWRGKGMREWRATNPMRHMDLGIGKPPYSRGFCERRRLKAKL